MHDQPLFDEVRSTTRPSWAADERAPDYAHLRTPPVEAAFTLELADLQLMADLNHFALDSHDTPILFGLRGCAVVRAAGPLTLKDQRPDHITPRCTIGVRDRRQGLISVFPAPTVPDHRAALGWKQSRKAGTLLATGLYAYIVGPHATVGASGRLNSRPGCFLLRENMGTEREIIVRRSSEDLSYELDDMHERSRPGDNIHPTFFTQPTDFSSFGCQTVVGFADNGGNHRAFGPNSAAPQVSAMPTASRGNAASTCCLPEPKLGSPPTSGAAGLPRPPGAACP